MTLDLSRISHHKQLNPDSCIPMSVETVLKLLNLMPNKDFSLQVDSAKSGNTNWIFPNFDYPAINPRVQFRREYLLSDIGQLDRGSHFMQNYFDLLFRTIDEELLHERFVIISLKSGPEQWHMEIIFRKISDSEYMTLTYYHGTDRPKIWPLQDLRTRVSAMLGTDILTYKWLN